VQQGKPQFLGRLHRRRGRVPIHEHMGDPQPAQVVQHDAQGARRHQGCHGCHRHPSEQTGRQVHPGGHHHRQAVRPTHSLLNQEPGQGAHRHRQRPARDQSTIVNEQSRAIGLVDI
jgi:hypothetical protein